MVNEVKYYTINIVRRKDVFNLDKVLEKIVYSIVQAIEVDLLDKIVQMNLETDNYVRIIKGDLINTRLKEILLEPNYYIHSFNRGGWKGRMIIDNENLNIYSITSMENLLRIPRVKERRIPHYMQSCLCTINKTLKASEQISFIDIGSKFADEVYLDDCNMLFNNVNINLDEFTYYILTYEHKYHKIVDVQLHLLDKDFQVVDKKSLNEFIKPDFANLTEVFISDDETISKTGKATTKELLAPRKGIKPKLKENMKEKNA